MTRKILITGGAGFLGSNLAQSLLQKKNEVIIFDNGFRVGFANTKGLKNFSLIKGSVTNTEDWKKIPKDIDFAFHLAAINGTRYFYEIPDKVLEVNIKGTINFMEWLKETNAKRFFFASSSEVYGFPKTFPTPENESLTIPDPKNPRFSYSSSKIVGETISINYGRSLGIEYSIARFHNVYGPHMGFEHVMPQFIEKCVKNQLFEVQGDGSESRCFCYISDAIDGIILLSEHSNAGNEIFNIGTNEEVTINQLINLLEKIHGKSLNPIFKKFSNAGTKRRIPDISRIKKLGYVPKVSLEEGFKKTYEWYVDYFKEK